jgi:hypothetical protein
MIQEDNEVKVKVRWISSEWPYEAKGNIDGKPFVFKANSETWHLSILKSVNRPSSDYAENIGWHYWGDTEVCFPGSSFITKSNIRKFIKVAANIWNIEDSHSYFRCKYLG